MVRHDVLGGILLGLMLVRPCAAQTPDSHQCSDYDLPDYGFPNGYPFDLHRVVTLFRFHRQTEALREIDAARAVARGPWRWRLPSDLRKEVASRLDALRDCLATTQPAPLARLAVHVLGPQYEPRRRIASRAGARVEVEDIDVGRTGPSGRLVARVPSGRIRVEAEDPITEWNSTDLSLAPGESRSIQIVLSDGKEVSEDTKLTLVEAVDDIVPVTSSTLTLRFMRYGRPAPVTDIDEIEVVDSTGGLQADLRPHFSVADGAIVATDPRRLFDALAPFLEKTIRLHVHAMTSPHEMHDGRVAFRVGQSPLRVTLAAPPSNPKLPLSNVQVGVSTLNGIAVERVSDAAGQFRVESFPHGTVAFECVVQSGGRYYYCDATLRHSGPRSVTLVLRHVEDLKAGVPPLRH